MPTQLPGPDFWTASKIRWEKIGTIHYGYGTPGYDGGASASTIKHAEASLVKEGYVGTDDKLTIKGGKYATELESKQMIVDRTP